MREVQQFVIRAFDQVSYLGNQAVVLNATFFIR